MKHGAQCAPGCVHHTHCTVRGETHPTQGAQPTTTTASPHKLTLVIAAHHDGPHTQGAQPTTTTASSHKLTLVIAAHHDGPHTAQLRSEEAVNTRFGEIALRALQRTHIPYDQLATPADRRRKKEERREKKKSVDSQRFWRSLLLPPTQPNPER